MDGLHIERGSLSEYETLARWHYRAAPPAVPVLTLRAALDDRLAGVLVIAMPVLNGPWRETAWPGWLTDLDKRGAALELNARLRTIARLVVAPPFRARGVASALVRTYLRSPLTHRTEALAAMGTLCPVFERAGMRRVDRPPGRAEARVHAALRIAGVRPWMLADARTRRQLSRSRDIEHAVRALATDRWRQGRDAPTVELLDRLWPYISARPAAFVHDKSRGP
ncbi:MAG: hypothetical protein QM783_19320 [Phycisphaerales bacterium]